VDELMLVRGFRAERSVPADAQERVRARMLRIVDGEPASEVQERAVDARGRCVDAKTSDQHQRRQRKSRNSRLNSEAL